MNTYYVYIMASESGVLYVGMTNNLERRIFEHKNKLIDGFTKKYNCDQLVYYESCSEVNVILEREKQLKKWNRAKKLALIMNENPDFKDLSTPKGESR